jgi:hypothetical protein
MFQSFPGIVSKNVLLTCPSQAYSSNTESSEYGAGNQWERKGESRRYWRVKRMKHTHTDTHIMKLTKYCLKRQV